MQLITKPIKIHKMLLLSESNGPPWGHHWGQAIVGAMSVVSKDVPDHHM